ncbi:branched-chain amino acid ABC transporter permease [Kerstersia gyiorum]|uniref:Amino acid/amide ABC transporter membrane protein 2 (HAAT family) n=1 Tax=Kerstersia gyiorum TaxID=206506 RepID=A0A171KR62_9BURK|nr:branched-chain amino acid ABC transporter permease [Kerstersia gyiorum]KKO71379.1 branched-chain amino acid ABC transporter permease [Kerstersia gyiorum]MCP1633393.1 branched-chain amino acid transport system permease protein [Kerstersia gyiorum]MCP1636264.1 branched-chain amino acid transport system permease protein [Kerstersia gyiorum]MCP1671168.1 branched-chain amino acid transport system permease protein [Kerstersia gyiorum]MCP1679174.1 branched-chain amino acid transport system permeas
MMKKLSPKHATLLVLAILIAVAPLFFPSSYYLRVGSLIFVNGLAVVGIVVLTGFVGQISLGHAGFLGIGAYACALAPKYLGLPVLPSALLGAVISGLLAWVVGRPILRLRGYYLSVATLGFGVLVAMVLTNEAWLTGGPDGIAVQDPGMRAALKDMGLSLNNAEFWYAFNGIMLVLGAWVALNLQYSATGRALRALHGSEVAARTVGVDVARFKLRGFVISAIYASLAGSLLAMQNRFITPDAASFMHSVEIVTMAVLGGAGSVLGAIFGAAVLTALPQVLTFFQEYEQIVLGLIMMLVMIFLRGGVLPSLARIIRGRG